MSITRVEAIPFLVPFVAPFATSYGVETHRQGLILRVDAGVEGLGECSPLPSFAPGTLEESRAALAGLAPRLIGLEPAAALGVVDAAIGGDRRLRPLLFALETALLDAIAREQGCPLPALLRASAQNVRTGGRGQAPPLRLAGVAGGGGDGGRTPSSDVVPDHATVVPVNATVARADAAEAAEAARGAIAAGFGCVKLKVGVAASATLEIERIARVRDAIGPTVLLRLDANGAWGVDQAIAILRAAARFDLDLVEQPVAAEDLDGLARVRRETGVPIGADESVTGLAAAEEMLRLEAADVLIVKPMPVGGLRAGRRIVELARDAEVGAIVTTTLETGVGVAAALHLAATLPSPIRPCGLATLPLLASSLIAGDSPALDISTDVAHLGLGRSLASPLPVGEGRVRAQPGAGRSGLDSGAKAPDAGACDAGPGGRLSAAAALELRDEAPGTPRGHALVGQALVLGRPLPQGSMIPLPAGPGLGVSLDEAALARYAAGEPMVFGS